jgi:hypothetical protein
VVWSGRVAERLSLRAERILSAIARFSSDAGCQSLCWAVLDPVHR